MRERKNTLVSIFSIKELRTKILYVIVILVIFRLGAVIPIPGIDPNALSHFMQQQADKGANNLVNYFNFFSGGAFGQFSVFMLGIIPYISMSIIMQLVLLAFPSLKKMSEQDGGRKKIKQYTRYGTIIIALVQSYLTVLYARQIPNVVVIPFWQYTLIAMLTVTTGTTLLMWMAEQINAHGIGNGASLIIFTGILARMPNALYILFQDVQLGTVNSVYLVIAFLLFIVIIALIIYEQQGQRRLPVHYARRMVGGSTLGGETTYIPLKLNPSGVIPVIFASAILNFPASLLSNLGTNNIWFIRIAHWLQPTNAIYIILYIVFIILFAYFYAQVTVNPKDITKRILSNGGSIYGVRAEDTENYIKRSINRIILPGALFLAFIAILPNLIMIIFQFPQQLAYVMGGTSLLILVGVDLDTMAQIEAHLKMHHHSGILNNAKIQTRNL